MCISCFIECLAKSQVLFKLKECTFWTNLSLIEPRIYRQWLWIKRTYQISYDSLEFASVFYSHQHFTSDNYMYQLLIFEFIVRINSTEKIHQVINNRSQISQKSGIVQRTHDKSTVQNFHLFIHSKIYEITCICRGTIDRLLRS